MNGKIVSVTSYGLTFFTPGGDFDNALNSSFGELSGYAPLWLNRAWIETYVPDAFGVIPEAGTWAMLIAGFGLVGAAARRRRVVATA